jgi:hypothetical protein
VAALNSVPRLGEVRCLVVVDLSMSRRVAAPREASAGLRLPGAPLRRQVFAAVCPWFTALQLLTTAISLFVDTAEAVSRKE